MFRCELSVSGRVNQPSIIHCMLQKSPLLRTLTARSTASKMTCIQILRGWRFAGDDGMTQMVGMEMDELKSESKIDNPPSIIHHTPSIIYYQCWKISGKMSQWHRYGSPRSAWICKSQVIDGVKYTINSRKVTGYTGTQGPSSRKIAPTIHKGNESSTMSWKQHLKR